MAKKQKLELTWVGKDERLKLEPRVLLEGPEKSYGDPNSENMLIFGDNLLSLKALEQDFAGKIKCIYIDPPYNTGSAFEHYDDGLEHSIWLNMMKERLNILKNLLAFDGLFFVQIDDYESDYLKVLCDEIFGRINYRNRFYVARTAKTNNSQFDRFKSYNNSVEYILCYARGEASTMNKILRPSTDKKHTEGQWKTFYQGDIRKTMQYEILGTKLDDGHWIWNKDRAYQAVQNYEIYLKYCQNNKIDIKEYWKITDSKLDFIKRVSGSNAKDNGVRYWISPKGGTLLSNNWTDILTYANDGYFPTAKSEKIMQRILEISTDEGDIILDSFAGSGTTGAVAHKMNRKWIMCELGEHCHTHIIPRMQNVIDGTDHGGISKAINWNGGGGFKYYRLAESLLVKDKDLSTDKRPVYVINPRYNETLLIKSICKIENFRYRKDGRLHGISSEQRFLHVTTRLLTQAYMESLSEDIGKDQSLLIYCSRKSRNLKMPDNVEIKKIPKNLLEKCDFEEDKK